MADMEDYDDLESGAEENVIAPPATAQELDELFEEIDEGEGTFASLSDEQRRELKEELGEEWVANYLDDYPIPQSVREATDEYHEIEAGTRFPNLPETVRNDILMQFNDHFGEGGPEHWDSAEDE